MLNMQQNELTAHRQGNAEYKRKSRQPKKTLIARHGLSTFDETGVHPHDIKQMIYTCSECGAVMFKDEKSDKTPSVDDTSVKFSLCCSNGGVKLPPIKEPLEVLKGLLTGNTKRDHHFRTNI